MSRGIERITAKDAERLFGETIALHRRGDHAGAEKRLNRLKVAFPDHPDVNHLLGVVRLALDRPKDALEPLRVAQMLAERMRPEILPGVLTALGSAERRAGEPANAARTLERAVRLAPGDADALFNLGNALMDLNRFHAACERFDAAHALAPDQADILDALGQSLVRIGRSGEARLALERATAIDPKLPKAHCALAAIYLFAGDFAAARRAAQTALDLDPDMAEAHANRAAILLSGGDADGAIAATRRAIALYEKRERGARGQEALAQDPRATAHSNLIFQMLYSPRCSAADILAEARAWNAVHAKSRESQESSPATPDKQSPGKQLNVGYLGGDFKTHPVGWFTLALFAAHDRTQVRSFVYMTAPQAGPAPDPVSEKIRGSADHWRDASDWDDVRLVEAIRADGIDILVDIAGHTAHNRLRAMGMRPAPVQATGFGVTGTTGVDAVDYLIADRVEIPPGHERFYSENIVRMPGDNVCYASPEQAPAVAPPPFRTNGYVTFGSFNAIAKASDRAVALWARVLKAVPDSRLLLKSFAFKDDEIRARYRDMFGQNDVGAGRLILEGPSPHAELLAAYGRVDIALDPIPYSGGLTTLESLWMGVPVVTLPGETFASRHSASHVSNAGLPELVARDADDYVAIASRLAADRDRLAALRASLRARLAASPVCDGARYAWSLEAAFREMWRRWCAGERPSAIDIPPS